MDLKEFLTNCELETKEGESFSLGYAITEHCCEQLANMISDNYLKGGFLYYSEIPEDGKW